MEFVDVLDEYGNKTGIVKEHSEAKRDKNYTLGVHVWIQNSKGEILLQKRSLQKHSFPGMWDTTGGKVRAFESSIEAIIRETKEELGIDIVASELEYILRFPAQKNSKPMFLDVYLLKKDIELQLLTLQTEEVDDVCCVPLSTVKMWYSENSNFVKQPYFLDLLKRLEENVYECQKNSSGVSGHQLLYSRKEW